MKIIKADFILTCRDDFKIIKDGLICFDKKIIEVGKAEDIAKKYNKAEIIYAGENSVLMPGLINPHVHLEFSANKTSLTYGSFIPWLNSVIQNRDKLLHSCDASCIQNQLTDMLESGTLSLGEISSFGTDIEPCLNTPQKVVFFNEVLGSRPDTVDVLFNDFKSRLHSSEEYESKNFIPAISIHSPYSTHPILAKNVLDIAREKNYLVSTHFMESKAERDWLENGKGDFKTFFNSFIPNARPLSSGLEYLEMFEKTDALFTHCTYANQKELEMIKKINGSITHCPASNRLLGSKRLELSNLNTDTVNLATDGLSSNTSLNLWDEMRSALMIHDNQNLTELSKNLLTMSTNNGAKALKINSGVLEKDRDADILVVSLPDRLESSENLATQLILHTKKANKIYIDGEQIK